jgi:predicted AAA+ superfamily ATPase
MYRRLCNPLISNSFFLFGARSTGKSSLLKSIFEGRNHLWIDLLDDENYLQFSRAPKTLQHRIDEKLSTADASPLFVVIDEVQKIPKLLNEVHRLIEHGSYKHKLLFALTGSSARKLKHGGANLLGGRALMNNLFPFTSTELGVDFNLLEVLQFGSLPHISVEQNITVKKELLKSYIGTYLREEIREEQIIRNLDPFVRFLEVSAQSSGKIINYAAIGRDCQTDSKTVARYFQILEETLLGLFLPAHHESVRKQQRQNPKFYFFDIGVQRALRTMLDIPVS